MFKLNTKFDADSLFYSLSHFECDSHTVHMLTQQCLLSPLTNTVKSSLFTHEHSSSLSLAARLHNVAQTVLVILTMAGLFPRVFRSPNFLSPSLFFHGPTDLSSPDSKA